MTPGPGIEPGTHWWEASALTTAPSLLRVTANASGERWYSRGWGSTYGIVPNEVRQARPKLDFSMFLAAMSKESILLQFN